MVDGPTIRFSCPECAKSIVVASEHAGKPGKCPRCRALLRVPSVPSQAGGHIVEPSSTGVTRNKWQNKGRTSKRTEDQSLSAPQVPSAPQRARYEDGVASKKISLSYPELGVSVQMVPDRHDVDDVSRAKRSSPAKVLLEILIMLVAVPLISILIFVGVTIMAVLFRSFFRMSHPDLHKGAVVGGVCAIICGCAMILLLLIYIPYHLWVSFCSARQEDPESCLKSFMRLRTVRPKRAYSLLTDQARSDGCVKILRTQEVASALDRLGQVHITTRRSFERYWELVDRTCILEPKWRKLRCRYLADNAAIVSVPIVISQRSDVVYEPTEYASKAPRSLDFTPSFLFVERRSRWFLASPWLWPFTFRFRGAHQQDGQVDKPTANIQTDHEEGSKSRHTPTTRETPGADIVVFDDVSLFCQFKAQLDLVYKATNS